MKPKTFMACDPCRLKVKKKNTNYQTGNCKYFIRHEIISLRCLNMITLIDILTHLECTHSYYLVSNVNTTVLIDGAVFCYALYKNPRGL